MQQLNYDETKMKQERLAISSRNTDSHIYTNSSKIKDILITLWETAMIYFHYYADDTQLYVSVKSETSNSVMSSVKKNSEIIQFGSFNTSVFNDAFNNQAPSFNPSTRESNIWLKVLISMLLRQFGPLFFFVSFRPFPPPNLVLLKQSDNFLLHSEVSLITFTSHHDQACVRGLLWPYACALDLRFCNNKKIHYKIKEFQVVESLEAFFLKVIIYFTW